jgi:uncharacterized protein YktA (UPF0223 family)
VNNFVTRVYNSFEVDPETRAFIIKKSKEKRLGDEIDYYENLPKDMKIFFPRLVMYSKAHENYKMGIEYYSYSNLGTTLINQPPDYMSSKYEGHKKIFNCISLFLKNCKKHTSQFVNSKQDCFDMYITKTEREQDNLIKNFKFFEEIENYDELEVNGQKLKPFRKIWPTIRSVIEEKYLDSKFSLIHGDLCFSNILCGKNEISGDYILKFIDPRGTFGSSKFVGDVYYDLAKISHSIYGRYEYIINDRFHIETDKNKIKFNHNIGIADGMYWLNKIFTEYVEKEGFDSTKIKIIEGTIFIGMCARHYDSLDRQKVMYFTGLKILNEIYEKLLH